MVDRISGFAPTLPLRSTTAATDKAAVRPKSRAEQTLDEMLTSLKGSSGTMAAEMARSRITQTRVKLAGLQLAAGSAAAMGDGRMARNVAEDIRDAARDLNRLFSGNGASAGVKPPTSQPLTPDASRAEPQSAAQSAAAQIKAAMGYGATTPLADADMAGLKGEVAEVAGALQKVMKRLMLTGRNPLVDPADRGAMQQMFGAAAGEIDRLRAATGSGATVNFKA